MSECVKTFHFSNILQCPRVATLPKAVSYKHSSELSTTLIGNTKEKESWPFPTQFSATHNGTLSQDKLAPSQSTGICVNFLACDGDMNCKHYF